MLRRTTGSTSTTSGRRPLRSHAFTLAALLLWTLPAAAAEWPPLVALGPGQALELTFQEERHVAFLTEPLRLEGTLRAESSGRLVRTVLQPAAERMVVEQQQVVIERPPGTAVATANLRANPAIEGLVTAMRALVANDRAALERSFTPTFAETATGWTLTLVPTSAQLRRSVEQIAVVGTGARVTGVEIAETNGDHSRIALQTRTP